MTRLRGNPQRPTRPGRRAAPDASRATSGARQARRGVTGGEWRADSPLCKGDAPPADLHMRKARRIQSHRDDVPLHHCENAVGHLLSDDKFDAASLTFSAAG